MLCRCIFNLISLEGGSKWGMELHFSFGELCSSFLCLAKLFVPHESICKEKISFFSNEFHKSMLFSVRELLSIIVFEKFLISNWICSSDWAELPEKVCNSEIRFDLLNNFVRVWGCFGFCFCGDDADDSARLNDHSMMRGEFSCRWKSPPRTWMIYFGDCVQSTVKVANVAGTFSSRDFLSSLPIP